MRSRRSPQIVTTSGVRPFDPGTFAWPCRARDYLAAPYTRPFFLMKHARQARPSPFYLNRLCTQAHESLGSFSTRFHLNSLTGLSPAACRSEARRVFGGLGAFWPFYYVPACFQRAFLAEH